MGASFSSSDSDIGAIDVDLRSLEAVPAEGKQCVLGHIVGDLDLLGDGVAACDGGLAGAKGSSVDALAGSTRVCLEGIAGKPICSFTG